MKFTITINCDNAAFHEDDRSENDDPTPEISRILRKLGKDLQEYAPLTPLESYPVIDANGNRVGYFKMEDN